MTSEKCPNCGAGIAPSAARCEYCGTAFTDAPDMTWTRVDRHLPPPDPAHPGRSVYVITLDLGDGLTFVSKKDKITHYWYDFRPQFLISAYYDFNTKKWNNELLGKRHREITPTHWMTIPPKSSSAWIAAADRLPQSDPADKATSYMAAMSIEVLVCDQNGDFPASVTIATCLPPPPLHPMWECYGLLNIDTNDVKAYDVSVTHWMLRPPIGPKE